MPAAGEGGRSGLKGLRDPLPQRGFLRGALTPEIVDVFARTGHAAVLEVIDEIGLSRWTAPVAPTSCRTPKW